MVLRYRKKWEASITSPKARRCAAGLTKTPFLFAPWLSRYVSLQPKEITIKASLKLTVVILVFIALGFVITVNLRTESPLFNFFFSPSDLYTPLAKTEISLKNIGTITSKEFINKYPGNHTIGILVSRPTRVGQNYDVGFSVKIEITENGVTKINKVISEPYFPFWGVNSNSGLALLHYRVPEDLPINKMLVVTATVVNPDPNFEEKYGNTKLYVQKMSDE